MRFNYHAFQTTTKKWLSPNGQSCHFPNLHASDGNNRNLCFCFAFNLSFPLSLLLQPHCLSCKPLLSLSLYCSLFSLMHSYLTLLLSCSLVPLSFFVVFSSHSSSPWQNSLHSLCIFASAFSSSMQFNFILPLLFPQIPNLSFHFSPFLPSLISSISFCFSLIIY